jgi:hypothetical protein
MMRTAALKQFSSATADVRLLAFNAARQQALLPEARKG